MRAQVDVEHHVVAAVEVGREPFDCLVQPGGTSMVKQAVVWYCDGVTVSAVQPVGTEVDRPLSAFTDPNAVLVAAPSTTAVVPAPLAALVVAQGESRARADRGRDQHGADRQDDPAP